MKTDHRHKKTTTSSTNVKAVTGLGCVKPTNKGAKQRPKTAASKLVSIQSKQPGHKKISNTVCNQSRGSIPNQSVLPAGVNDKEFSGQRLLSPTPPLTPAVSTTVPRQSSLCFQKFKLQLFPIDEATGKGLEMEKHNPYLELTIGARKKISSVVKHLNSKWGKLKMASGELMLFPYYARLENLCSHMRWTLKDSDTSATDVHVAIDSPSVFRLRYGWFSDVGPQMSRLPLMVPLTKDSLQMNENEKKSTADDEKHAYPTTRQGREPSAAADDSNNKDIDKPVLLDKTVQPVDNKVTSSSSTLLLDMSNISFGALLCEASRNVNIGHNTCDSFDADIARLKATIQSAPVPKSSIFDAEETCNAFCFQKLNSSCGTVPAQPQDAPFASSIQNASSNPLRLHAALNSQAAHLPDNACQKFGFDLQLNTASDACLKSRVDAVNEEEHDSQAHSEASYMGKPDTNWPDSLNPFEYAAPSSKQFIFGDSIGLGGLISSSLDAFQSFSIF